MAMRVLLLSSLCLLLLASGLVGVQASSPLHPSASASDRVVCAFYYAWFDENTWRPNVVPDMPRETYRSTDRAAIARHVRQAQSAGIDALVVSWLGTGNQTDWNLSTMLSVAAETGFKVSLDFETNSPFLHSQSDIVQALKHAMSTHAGHPNFLRYQGKPVIFFWRLAGVPTNPGQTPLQAWESIRNQVDPNRSTIWIAEGTDISYQQVFDGHHLYSIAWSRDVGYTLGDWGNRIRNYNTRNGCNRLWVATVMPGYNDLLTGRPDAFVRDRQGGAFYNSCWDAAIASQPDMVIITSFNEWVEGSQIEPSVSYGDHYLNLTRDAAARYKSSASAPSTPAGSRGLDYDIPNGHFYTQGNGKPLGTDGAGFAVTNDGGVRFWDEFRRLGGVQGVGYPISQRFTWNGFTCQVMQRGVLQWRPEVGQAWLVNVFDQMHDAGKDDWLQNVRSTPRPLDASFDAGKSWEQVVAGRLALLDANPAIKRQYYAVSDPMTFYGLPTSRVIDMGNHYAIRLQRAVIQQWKADVPWARAGQVTVANGGDVSREVGLFDQSILVPSAAP